MKTIQVINNRDKNIVFITSKYFVELYFLKILGSIGGDIKIEIINHTIILKFIK